MNLLFRAYKKIKSAFDYLAEKSIHNDYKLYSPYYYIYPPWDLYDFMQHYKKIEGHTVVTPDRAYLIRQLSLSCRDIEGDYAECGVFRGGTSYLIAEAINGSDKTLHCFDTFEGMPITARNDPSGHKPGEMGETSEKFVDDYLKQFKTELHAGFIPLTLLDVREKQFAFVHIDLDIYRSVHDAVAFFYPRMSKGGIMLFDDYGFYGYQEAAKKAVDEFFESKEPVIMLPTGQAMIIKK